ncbi:MAG: hypothetical protein DYH05_04710 [Acidobacteria bacterium ACB1]|nr:hypothetical protein [Acidobacteria bacterium ACB1]
MSVIGTFLEPLGTTTGTIELIPTTQIGPGPRNFFNTRVPAKWRFQYWESFMGQVPCVGGVHTVERNVHLGEMEKLPCYAYVFPISINPSTVDAVSPPSTIAVEAEGISDTYGPPQVAILDEFGNVRASIAATVTNLGKGQMEFTLPNVSTYYNGVYQITVNNVSASGRWEAVGAGELSLFGNTPPSPPNLPDPCSIPAPCLF